MLRKIKPGTINNNAAETPILSAAKLERYRANALNALKTMLPLSSGTSRWHQTQDNRILIDKAVELIAYYYSRLFPGQ